MEGFLKLAYGNIYLNLSNVTRVIPQSDGTAQFFLQGTDYEVVTFGTTLADAVTGVERLIQPVDGSLYA